MSEQTQTANTKLTKQNNKTKTEKKDIKNTKKKAEDEMEEEQSSEQEEFYNVEKIIDFKKQKNRDFFLVKWEGYDEPTWEPKTNLSNVKLLIEEFWKNSKEKKTKTTDPSEESKAIQEVGETKKQITNGASTTSTTASASTSSAALGAHQTPNSRKSSITAAKPPNAIKDANKKEDLHNISISSTKGKIDEEEQEEDKEGTANIKNVKIEEMDEEKQSVKKSPARSGDSGSEQQQASSDKVNKLHVSNEDSVPERKGSSSRDETTKTVKQIDQDAVQQEQKILNKKRKNTQSHLDEEEDQNETRNEEESHKYSSEQHHNHSNHHHQQNHQDIEVKGTLEEHIPIDISKAIFKLQKFQYMVEWKQQKGFKITQSLVSSEDLQKRYGDLIVKFYEEKALKRK